MDNVKNYSIYKLTSPSGKVYIGQTCQKPEHRWNRGKGYKHNQYLYSAIQKYGWDNFKCEVVSTELTDKEADWLEQYLIAYYNSSDRKYGYNIEGGGNANKVVSEETRRKNSEAHKGHHYNLGRTFSDETKRKMSEAAKGRKKPEGWTENMREKMLFDWEKRKANGWKMPDSAKKRISEFQKGKPSHNRAAVKVNGVIYSSQAEAAKALNITPSHFCSIMKGKKKNVLNLKIEKL